MVKIEPKICLMIPTYRVAKYVGSVLNRLPQQAIDRVSHILIVDNASDDDTVAVVQKVIKERNLTKAQVLSNERNYMLGGSTVIAIDWALKQGCDFLVCMHSDGQADPDDLEKLMFLSTPEIDLVLGSRLLATSRVAKYSLVRLLGNKFFSLLQRWIIGADVRDIGAFISFNLKTISELPWVQIPADMSYQPLLILTAFKKRKIRYVEVPITWGAVAGDNVNPWRYGLIFLRRLILFALNRIPLTNAKLSDFRYRELGSIRPPTERLPESQPRYPQSSSTRAPLT